MFEPREYVWDRVWESPAVVVSEPQGSPASYTVAEIDQWRRLGRVAQRTENQLCRYVRVILPEDEADAIVKTYGKRTTSEKVSLRQSGIYRIVTQLVRRGVYADASS